MYILDYSSEQNAFVNMASGTRKKRRDENQENVKHVLDEIWDSDPDDILCKIFSRDARGGIKSTMNLSKEDKT